MGHGEIPTNERVIKHLNGSMGDFSPMQSCKGWSPHERWNIKK